MTLHSSFYFGKRPSPLPDRPTGRSPWPPPALQFMGPYHPARSRLPWTVDQAPPLAAATTAVGGYSAAVEDGCDLPEGEAPSRLDITLHR